jgi:hypothetical protein
MHYVLILILAPLTSPLKSLCKSSTRRGHVRRQNISSALNHNLGFTRGCPGHRLAVAARADSPGSGFTDPPYNYSDEYRDCAWPDDGSGRRYVPGYPIDRERSRCAEEKAPARPE